MISTFMVNLSDCATKLGCEGVPNTEFSKLSKWGNFANPKLNVFCQKILAWDINQTFYSQLQHRFNFSKHFFDNLQRIQN